MTISGVGWRCLNVEVHRGRGKPHRCHPAASRYLHVFRTLYPSFGRSSRFVTKILLIHIKVISDDQMPLHLYHGYPHTVMNVLHIQITLVHSPVRLSRERVGYLSWSCLLGIVHKTRSYSQTALQTNSVGMINDKVVIVRISSTTLDWTLTVMSSSLLIPPPLPLPSIPPKIVFVCPLRNDNLLG